jgi:hypothetical protein
MPARITALQDALELAATDDRPANGRDTVSRVVTERLSLSDSPQENCGPRPSADSDPQHRVIALATPRDRQIEPAIAVEVAAEVVGINLPIYRQRNAGKGEQRPHTCPHHLRRLLSVCPVVRRSLGHSI